MRRQVIISGLVLSLLAGCATVKESRFNPLNWFGKSEPVAVDANGQQVVTIKSLAPRKGYPVFVDTRPLAPTISDVQVVQSASGAIVTATAALPSTGYFDAELVPVASERADTLVLEFRLRTPEGAAPAGTSAQRRITAARSLSFDAIAGIRTIIVKGADGARQVRR
ncbi:hypothetical protein CEW89_06170 [Celeribacter ethanolicus]|uniref:Lipoprotein n=1 Tax=Celeribacter ethanolicus TaxID=1758178 RepID=A0A291GAX2_9RHOB|nr:hypothetical protein [Celeribacter ethanolicus]ATG47190.1 hypothetical protein CEW89_06170 [Celeribacter ethanolicus]TNE64962.1 MAG: hypothetical protein EP336_14255 [Paracoccaceae bacterium]